LCKPVLPEGTQLTEVHCLYLIANYLKGQGWQLVEPRELAAQVWLRLQDRHLAGPAAEQIVQQETLQRYAVILHDCCRRPEESCYEQAWLELRQWLARRVQRLEPNPSEQDDLIQETLAALKPQLLKTPLQTPYTFLAYAAQAMQHKQIDLVRHQTSQRRDRSRQDSVEELEETKPFWESTISDQKADWRTMEGAVSDAEVRRQLQDFFRRHLPTELQWQVAEAHFLDGLTPVEIAGLMGKRPHEVRMVKARVVEQLRNLPPAARQELLTILDQLNRGTGHES
jgi:RNA polymerase sigma factor (sigma-70 family)